MNSHTEIKKAIICKSVKEYTISAAGIKHYIPKEGDVGIFEVLSIGKHKAIQGATGKNSYIFPGDHIMATFGNRYATNQFEGYVPTQVEETYQILGQGGCIGILKSTHAKFSKIGATELRLVGYAVNPQGQVINTQYLTEEKISFKPEKKRPYQVILSVGSSMDSGKTTSAAYLCRGLKKGGHKVGFIKLTGTVYSRDKRFVQDCGADMALDFSNLGFPSTYMYELEEILSIYESLLTKLEAINPDYVVVEIADGLLQRETKMLLQHQPFMATVDHIMLSCGDSLGVLSGLAFLHQIHRQPFAISGLINVSPLLVDEVRNTIELPVLDLQDLECPEVVQRLPQPQTRINGRLKLTSKVA
ncbi:MAG: hypothetical protein AAFR61_01670 [Bacteroidota bacterium]